MCPSSPHLPTRWLCCALGVLPSAKRMHLLCVGHRLEKRLCGAMHLTALGLPMVALAMELLHHPFAFIPHSLHRLFQELEQLSRHLLVIAPESCEHMLSLAPQLRPNGS